MIFQFLLFQVFWETESCQHFIISVRKLLFLIVVFFFVSRPEAQRITRKTAVTPVFQLVSQMGDNFTQLRPTPTPNPYFHPQFCSQGAKLSTHFLFNLLQTPPTQIFFFCFSPHYYFMTSFIYTIYLLILTHECSRVPFHSTCRGQNLITTQSTHLHMDALFFQGCLCWRVIRTRPEYYVAQVFCIEEEPCVKLDAGCHICEQFRNHWL